MTRIRHKWKHLKCEGTGLFAEKHPVMDYRCFCPRCGKCCARSSQGRVHAHKPDGYEPPAAVGWDANGSPTP